MVDDELIAFVARNMKQWETLKLVNEAEEIEIHKDFQRYRDQKKAALEMWKENNSEKATATNLIEAFQKAGDSKLADKTKDFVTKATE